MSALPKQFYTLQEYFALDAVSDERLEYWDGEIYSMSGASEEHDEIELNLVETLRPRLRHKGCRVFSANMRIKVPAALPYRYGDLSALCGEARFEKIGGVDVLLNPALIIEVLSPSTEDYDREGKFGSYKSIESFREYLLIAQDRPHVMQHVRRDDGAWESFEFKDLQDVVRLVSADCELRLSEIYEDITFPMPLGLAD
jgi:Uma2 family endonuclease